MKTKGGIMRYIADIYIYVITFIFNLSALGWRIYKMPVHLRKTVLHTFCFCLVWLRVAYYLNHFRISFSLTLMHFRAF
jgi:hypothetical protein